MIGFETEGFLELTDRLINLPFPDEGDAEGCGPRCDRLETEGFLDLTDRVVDLALPGEGEGEVVVRLGVSGLDAGFSGIGGSPRRFGLSCRGRRRGC